MVNSKRGNLIYRDSEIREKIHLNFVTSSKR